MLEEYKPKCIKCKRIVEKPNRLVPVWEGSQTKWCLICMEDMTHKNIVDYLEGKVGVIFYDGEDGSGIIIPGRYDVNSCTNQELLNELVKRMEG